MTAPAILAQRIALADILSRYPPAARKRWFSYGVDFVTPNQLPASGTLTQAKGVDRDSAFIIMSLAGVVTNTDNTTYIDSPSILIQVTVGTALQLFDPPAHWLNVFGRGAVGDGRIQPLEWPREADPGATLTVTLQNLDATARHVRIIFRGIRVYGV
jgi:hypothetical protein